MTALGLLLLNVWATSANTTLTLSTDQSAHYLHEAVQLRLAVRNEGEKSVSGYFDSSVEMYYRRGNTAFVRFKWGEGFDRKRQYVSFGPRVVAPHEEQELHLLVSFDLARQGFVLDQPGNYEFKAVYRDPERTPVVPIESNVVSVTANAPPESDTLAEYSREMALLAQNDRSVLFDRAALRSAAEFIERHSESVYAGPVRKGLRVALALRKSKRIATRDEEELLRQLWAKELLERH